MFVHHHPLTQALGACYAHVIFMQHLKHVRAYHPHDEREPLTPGQVYEVDVEIWPMSLWLPQGSRLALTVQGKDFERPGEAGPNRGVGFMTHDDPVDRPPAIFGATNALHTGGRHESYLLMPVIFGG